MIIVYVYIIRKNTLKRKERLKIKEKNRNSKHQWQWINTSKGLLELTSLTHKILNCKSTNDENVFALHEENES